MDKETELQQHKQLQQALTDERTKIIKLLDTASLALQLDFLTQYNTNLKEQYPDGYTDEQIMSIINNNDRDFKMSIKIVSDGDVKFELDNYCRAYTKQDYLGNTVRTYRVSPNTYNYLVRHFEDFLDGLNLTYLVKYLDPHTPTKIYEVSLFGNLIW